MKSDEIADLIATFISGDLGPYDWDDFTSIDSRDPLISKIKDYCNTIQVRYPPPHNVNAYCNILGLEKLETLAAKLKEGFPQAAVWLAMQEENATR